MSTLLKSVCLIAESNGGAPGCGNCDSCKGERA